MRTTTLYELSCNPCYYGNLLHPCRTLMPSSSYCNPCYNGNLLHRVRQVRYRAEIVILVIMEACYILYSINMSKSAWFICNQYLLNFTNWKSETFLPSLVISASLSVVEAIHVTPCSFISETTLYTKVISPMT